MTNNIDQKIYPVKVIMLYGFFILGGISHILNHYQLEMNNLTALILFTVSLILVVENQRIYFKNLAKRFLLWCGFIIFAGFFVELAGNKTGIIFGNYEYGDILQPQLFNVPLLMGCAWLEIQLSSIGFVQHLLFRKKEILFFQLLLFTAIAMLFFDFLLEPAASMLNYWVWEENNIPAKNYISWFLVSSSFSLLGLKLGILKVKLNPISMHAYIGQIIYFAMVNLKSLL